MSRPEEHEGEGPESARAASGGLGPGPRPGYGRYVGLLGVLIVVLALLNAALSKHNGASGLEPGRRLPPFAVPLATGNLPGQANVATTADQGAAGRKPACSVRGPQILNICQLYESGPVVLALFVDSGSCPAILGDMQALVRPFPGVRFAAVALGGDRSSVRGAIRARGVSFPVGIDGDGALLGLYRDATCPQVTFAYPGGVVQSRALLTRPSQAALRARVQTLLAGSEQRGWRPPAR
ncbi:MAG TPA: hypothetical protein VHY83_01180 [Solirubrobacteraceae bacterium]|jgi:hypothetical protein|nr:hypothetical protein [Solirubrobacteraceae bacterium]